MSDTRKHQIYRELRQKGKELNELARAEREVSAPKSSEYAELDAEFDKLYHEVNDEYDRNHSAQRRRGRAAFKKEMRRRKKHAEKQEISKNILHDLRDGVE